MQNLLALGALQISPINFKGVFNWMILKTEIGHLTVTGRFPNNERFFCYFPSLFLCPFYIYLRSLFIYLFSAPPISLFSSPYFPCSLISSLSTPSLFLALAPFFSFFLLPSLNVSVRLSVSLSISLRVSPYLSPIQSIYLSNFHISSHEYTLNAPRTTITEGQIQVDSLWR